MRNLKIMLLVSLLFSGCAFNREIVMQAEGQNVKTPYGTGNGKFFIHTTTRIGK